MGKEKYIKILESVFSDSSLKKAVFSRVRNKKDDLQKSVLTPFEHKGVRCYQLESFYKDGKARHINMTAEEALEYMKKSPDDFSQINIISSAGSCDVLVSSKGAYHISGSISKGEAVEIAAHNRAKNYILDPKKHSDFFAPLGVCDENGNIFEKKRSKFRQIERFIELVDDMYDRLPASGTLCICDLCCGKSYLTFAVYYYLVKIKNRSVRMFGVDLKKDVIDFCSDLSKRLSYDGLEFIHMDVSKFDPMMPVDAVISLHACDIATDFVLSFAINKKAKLIFSTPCCHHEMMHQIDCPELSFITKYSILSQKLCDAATDSLRALMLEASGYSVEAVELIDPEETPKNVMLRAEYKNIGEKQKADAREKYAQICKFLGVDPYLSKLV